jgi:hypothetical protein
MVVTPPEQQWPSSLTQALVVCCRRQGDRVSEFDVLTALPRVPIDGLADARATAAMLIANNPAPATARGPVC